MTGAVTMMRKWQETEKDVLEYSQGNECVGGVLVTEYGTICFTGPLGRGTSESVEGAKQAVEQMFDPESAYSQMIRAAVTKLSQDRPS